MLGTDSIWLSDRVVSDVLNVQPLIALSFVAARTTKLEFGASVLALPLRGTTLLAKEIATLDYLSGGRVLPAVGFGTEDEREFKACGSQVVLRLQVNDKPLSQGLLAGARLVVPVENHAGQDYLVYTQLADAPLARLRATIGGVMLVDTIPLARIPAAPRKCYRTVIAGLFSSPSTMSRQVGIRTGTSRRGERDFLPSFGGELERGQGALLSPFATPEPRIKQVSHSVAEHV